jgi:hypothetical protein
VDSHGGDVDNDVRLTIPKLVIQLFTPCTTGKNSLKRVAHPTVAFSFFLGAFLLTLTMPPRCAVCAREGGDAGIYRCLSCTYGDLDPFDICSACEKLSSHYHDSTHVFLYVKPVAITTLLGWDTEPLNRVPRPLADANVPSSFTVWQSNYPRKNMRKSLALCSQMITFARTIFWRALSQPHKDLPKNCFCSSACNNSACPHR